METLAFFDTPNTHVTHQLIYQSYINEEACLSSTDSFIPNTHSFHALYSNLNKKNKEHFDVQSTSLGTVCTMLGHRSSQEDAHCLKMLTLPTKTIPIRAVFDGHGGPEVSTYLAHHISQILSPLLSSQILENEDSLYHCLVEACVKLDDHCKTHYTSGSTMVLSLVINERLYTCNIGDSRGLLVRSNSDTIPLTRDHKPDSLDILTDIESRNGHVFTTDCPRINGILAVGRAFGNPGLVGTSGAYLVQPIPDISIVPLCPGDTVILCCDGITDVASSKEIGHAVQQLLKTGHTPQDIAQYLCLSAYYHGSHDNLSALVFTC